MLASMLADRLSTCTSVDTPGSPQDASRCVSWRAFGPMTVRDVASTHIRRLSEMSRSWSRSPPVPRGGCLVFGCHPQTWARRVWVETLDAVDVWALTCRQPRDLEDAHMPKK